MLAAPAVVAEGAGKGGAGKGGSGKGGAGPEWPTWEVLDDSGNSIGFIKYGAADAILSAHCRAAGHGLCRMNRTVRPNPRKPGQGRPLGLLIAWLRLGADLPDRMSHKDATSGITLHDRSVARDWVLANPSMVGPLSKERPREDSEGPEPEVL